MTRERETGEGREGERETRRWRTQVNNIRNKRWVVTDPMNTKNIRKESYEITLCHQF